MDFAAMIPFLMSGRSVRRAAWGKTTKMYVSGGQTLCQVGKANGYQYDLSWHEIIATDWSVV